MQVNFDKSRQSSNRRAAGLIDLDAGIYNDELMSNASEDEKEEIEAFIKKRVKEGSGRDYESIVKKDIITYHKLG